MGGRDGGREGEERKRERITERSLSSLDIWSILLLSNKETSIYLGWMVETGKLLFLHEKENRRQCEKSQQLLKPFCSFWLLVPGLRTKLMKSSHKEATWVLLFCLLETYPPPCFPKCLLLQLPVNCFLLFLVFSKPLLDNAGRQRSRVQEIGWIQNGQRKFRKDQKKNHLFP